MKDGGSLRRCSRDGARRPTAGHEGQNYPCTGSVAIDMPQVAADFTKLLGRDIAYYDLPEDEFADMLLEHGGYSDSDQLEIELLCHLRAWKEGRAETVTTEVERLTGNPPNRRWSG